MFGPVSRRILRKLVYVLVAGQLLLSAPVVDAATFVATSTSTAAADAMPCGHEMPAPDHGKPCPCCPDGVTGMAACLSACVAMVGALSPDSQVPFLESGGAVVALAPHGALGAAEPPLDPPPIV